MITPVPVSSEQANHAALQVLKTYYEFNPTTWSRTELGNFIDTLKFYAATMPLPEREVRS